jgi:HK97 family phage major capsid protein
MNKKELQAKLARLAAQMRASVDKLKAESRLRTSLEREEWDKMLVDYEAAEADLKALERIDGIENSLAQVNVDNLLPFNPNANGVGGIYDAGREARRQELISSLTTDPRFLAGPQVAQRTGFSLASDPRFKALGKLDNSPHNVAFAKFLAFGMSELTSEEKALMRNRFVALPNGIQNAQTITTTGGGYLIPQGFSDQLEVALKWYGGILGEVGVFETETGNPLPWPTENDTANKGRILAINTQLTETDLVFGQVTFNAWIGTSDLILVPLALMQDSYFDLNAHIATQLGIRLGRLLNNMCTVGTGNAQPNGIVTAAVAAGNIFTGATGQATSITYTSLVDLLHSVDPAYRANPSAKFMFADTTLKALRLLVDGNNRPLWQPGITAGFGQGFPETILDRPYVINQDMATMAANAYSVLFGDLSKYKVRRVAGGVTIMRLVERYVDYLQEGFLGFMRFDGQLLDAGTHPIAVFQNSAT